MKFAYCACSRSLAKLGIPSIESDHERYPDCPECGRRRKVLNLTELAQEIMGVERERCMKVLCGDCREGIPVDEQGIHRRKDIHGHDVWFDCLAKDLRR